MFCKKMEPKNKEYTIIHVEQPKLIDNNNQHMGGTDEMDQQIACYNPLIKIGNGTFLFLYSPFRHYARMYEY